MSHLTSSERECESEGPLPSTAREGERDESMPPVVAINVPKDFLIVHSTMPYQVSKRNEETGSWFLHELHQAFDSDKPGTDVNFLELLTRANERVSQCESKKKLDPESIAYLEPKEEEKLDPESIAYLEPKEEERLDPESIAYLEPKEEENLDHQKSGNKCTIVLSHRLCTDLVFPKSATDERFAVY